MLNIFICNVHLLIFSKCIIIEVQMIKKHLNLIISHRGKISLQVTHYSGLY